MIDALSELEIEEGHEPWCDLVFEIVEDSRGKDAVVFRASGFVPSGEIGFEARVPRSEWNEKVHDDNFVTHWGYVTLRSVGQATNQLLGLYEKWFGVQISGANVPAEIRCLTVLINSDPADFESKKISAKLFFDGSEEQSLESYAELFFNFDLSDRRAWLREKDPEYRVPLVGWLAGRYLQAGQAVH